MENLASFADYSNNEAAGIPSVFYGAGLTYSPEFFKQVL